MTDGKRSADFTLARDDLQRAVAWIAAQAHELGATPRQSFAAQLCAEELLVNAIDHGGRARLSVAVTLESLGDRLRLTLADDGAAFTLAAAPERKLDPSLDAAGPGGWGVALVRRFADGVDCRRADGGNIMILDFNRGVDP